MMLDLIAFPRRNEGGHLKDADVCLNPRFIVAALPKRTSGKRHTLVITVTGDRYDIDLPLTDFLDTVERAHEAED